MGISFKIGSIRIDSPGRAYLILQKKFSVFNLLQAQSRCVLLKKDTNQQARPLQCHWSSAPALALSQVLVLCSWLSEHWHGWLIGPSRRWATAYQIRRRALPFRPEPASQSGSQNLLPSFSQVCWWSVYSKIQIMNQWADTLKLFDDEDLVSYVPGGVMTYVVIWDSRKMRMKTSKAGMQDANINHTGKDWCSPKGLMSQPLFSGLDTVNPLGTTSFCK